MGDGGRVRACARICWLSALDTDTNKVMHSITPPSSPTMILQQRKIYSCTQQERQKPI